LANNPDTSVQIHFNPETVYTCMTAGSFDLPDVAAASNAGEQSARSNPVS